MENIDYREASSIAQCRFRKAQELHERHAGQLVLLGLALSASTVIAGSLALTGTLTTVTGLIAAGAALGTAYSAYKALEESKAADEARLGLELFAIVPKESLESLGASLKGSEEDVQVVKQWAAEVKRKCITNMQNQR